MRNLIYICLSFFWCVPSFSSELSPWESVQTTTFITTEQGESYTISDKILSGFDQSSFEDVKYGFAFRLTTPPLLGRPQKIGKITTLAVFKESPIFSLNITTKNKNLSDFYIEFYPKHLSEKFQIIDSLPTQKLNLYKKKEGTSWKEIYHYTLQKKKTKETYSSMGISYSIKTLNFSIHKILEFLYDHTIFPDAVLDDLIKRIPLKDFRHGFDKFVESINSMQLENGSEEEFSNRLYSFMEDDKSLYQQGLCAQYIKKWMDEVVAENPDDAYKRIGIAMCTYVNDPELPEYTDIKLIENDLILSLHSTTHNERMNKYLKVIKNLEKLDQQNPFVQNQLCLWRNKYLCNDQVNFENLSESHLDLFYGLLKQTQYATESLQALRKKLQTLRKDLQSKDQSIADLTQENSRNQSRIRELENRLNESRPYLQSIKKAAQALKNGLGF